MILRLAYPICRRALGRQPRAEGWPAHTLAAPGTQPPLSLLPFLPIRFLAPLRRAAGPRPMRRPATPPRGCRSSCLGFMLLSLPVAPHHPCTFDCSLGTSHAHTPRCVPGPSHSPLPPTKRTPETCTPHSTDPAPSPLSLRSRCRVSRNSPGCVWCKHEMQAGRYRHHALGYLI